MERTLVLGIFPWGTISDFAEPDEITASSDKLRNEGATEVLVGQEAQRYQALQGEIAWVQEMADHDWRP